MPMARDTSPGRWAWKTSTTAQEFKRTFPIDSTGSAYSVGADNRGCMAIATSAGTSIYRFALGVINSGVASKGRFIEF